jgi:dipicolinate synthase subunit B
MSERIRLGFAVTGSFCTFSKMLESMAACRDLGYEILPIVSAATATTDTRFGRAEDFIRKIEEICGRPVIRDIPGAEPIGPKDMTDILLVAPCTGNTLAKLAAGITDNAVTMAVKSHLRGAKPVVLAVSTNDALSGSAANLGTLLNRRHYYFVPFRQDDPVKKPTSLVADFTQIPAALDAALHGKQIQPLLAK